METNSVHRKILGTKIKFHFRTRISTGQMNAHWEDLNWNSVGCIERRIKVSRPPMLCCLGAIWRNLNARSCLWARTRYFASGDGLLWSVNLSRVCYFVCQFYLASSPDLTAASRTPIPPPTIRTLTLNSAMAFKNVYWCAQFFRTQVSIAIVLEETGFDGTKDRSARGAGVISVHNMSSRQWNRLGSRLTFF